MPQFSYELPPLVKSLQHGWLASCQSAAVVSALLAGLAGQFLVFMKDDTNFPNNPSPDARKFLLMVSYSAVAFNCSATISSLILTDKLGELPISAARISEEKHTSRSSTENDNGNSRSDSQVERGNGMMDGGSTHDTSMRLLVRYGAGEVWIWTMLHWLFCLVAGIFSIMIQILIYIILEEPKPVQITMTCVVAFAIFPPFIFLLKPAEGKPRTTIYNMGVF